MGRSGRTGEQTKGMPRQRQSRQRLLSELSKREHEEALFLTRRRANSLDEDMLELTEEYHGWDGEFNSQM